MTTCVSVLVVMVVMAGMEREVVVNAVSVNAVSVNAVSVSDVSVNKPVAPEEPATVTVGKEMPLQVSWYARRII